MLFRIIAADQLRNLYEILAVNPVLGPVGRGPGSHGQELFGFDLVTGFDELRLDYTTTHFSPKRFFLPHRETLATFEVDGIGWRKKVDYNIDRPRVFFGLHACDINALNKLDKVLLEGPYPTPYYAGKRRNTFIIGIGCTPLPFCFCRSMGTDTVLHGFDMFLTSLGDRYFVEIHSATAYNFIQQLENREPDEADHLAYMQVVAERNKKFTASVDTTDLTKILDMEFQSGVWQNWGDRCLSCGTCANVCPTCYCYGVEERVDLALRKAVKERQLYSCNLLDFAEVAGGHNFRPASATRLKYRYYHKHRGFVEAFEESLCVGCGRCGEACLADITVPEVIQSVRHGEVTP